MATVRKKASTARKTKKATRARVPTPPPTVEDQLAECFALFADPKFTGNLKRKPVSRIVFSCQGDITTPPDFGCMGYGAGRSGEVFSATGTLDLTPFLASGLTKKAFALACKQVTAGLQALAGSKAFAAIPKDGPIIFGLAVVDQYSQVLGRVHPDGRFELPPPRP